MILNTYAVVQNRLRQTIYPRLKALTSSTGGKVRYTLRPDEYACTIAQPPSEVRKMLWDAGFSPAPIAALKETPEDEQSVGSWVDRDSPLWTSDMQYHVHIFADGSGGTHLYAHYEFNWWPAPSDPTRPKKHYFPAAIYDPPRGVNHLLNQLDEVGIGYSFTLSRMVNHPRDLSEFRE